MIRRQTACAWLCAMLPGTAHPGVNDHPAGRLPTHYLVAPGDDAWSGRLHALQFRPPPDMPETARPPAMWEAAKLLDAREPDTRRLWTFRQGDAFDRTAVPLRWESLAPRNRSCSMARMATASSGLAICAACVAMKPSHRNSVAARRSSVPYVARMCSCSGHRASCSMPGMAHSAGSMPAGDGWSTSAPTMACCMPSIR